MCGICGFVDVGKAFPPGEYETMVERMAGTLVHRGPDDRGSWVDEEAGVALGHRRLAILDLSREGRQPMVSHSGRLIIVYNGETYNYRTIREELPNVVWRGSSDTEVMLEACEHWGVEEALEWFVGMFAFALWDREERVLYLVRDRLGIKPLYYGSAGGTLVFASELKAFHAYPTFQADIDREGLARFLRLGYVPEPLTIYRGIRKLPPGTIVRVHFERMSEWSEPRPYWSAQEIARRGLSNPFVGTGEAAVQALDVLLDEAVALRMIADVPLGALLSGGIDSSVVVAKMCTASPGRVKTFTIGFAETEYDEAPSARRVARHLGTDHTEFILTPEESRSLIPSLPELYDEPFADSSQIPTALLCRLTRESVTVALSGDGGDELFAGYTRHVFGPDLWRRISGLPLGIRRMAGGWFSRLSPRLMHGAYQVLDPLLKSQNRQRQPAEKFRKLASVLDVTSPGELYQRLVSQWRDPAAVVIGVTGENQSPVLGWRGEGTAGVAGEMMLADLVTYLPGDILSKIDRASMGFGLEVRVPLLDHRVVEFAWTLPMHLKVWEGKGKWILRQVLDKYVPRDLVERPKMGFAVPLASWLRGPLRDWAEDLLAEERLKREGYFRPEPVRQVWRDHLTGKSPGQHQLWCVLMFEAWLARWG
ncbi:MAG TPA: asparagine synthase (glutamine-hydrolyzing) [Atribacteraceae bacterium]|nr:asparagine synthase (glutamine-hydrolyzing) [Atribacteraceae bacterium]